MSKSIVTMQVPPQPAAPRAAAAFGACAAVMCITFRDLVRAISMAPQRGRERHHA